MIVVFETIVGEIIGDLHDRLCDSHKEKSLKKQIEKGINQVLKDEEGNVDFDILDKTLTNSKILQDYASSLIADDEYFRLGERLSALKESIDGDALQVSRMMGVVSKLCNVIRRNIIDSLGKDARVSLSIFLSQLAELSDKQDEINELLIELRNELRFPQIPLTFFQSHPIPTIYGNHFIRRQIIPNDQGSNQKSENNTTFHAEYFELSKRILLLGDAGSGKTFTLYQIYNETKQGGNYAYFYRLNELSIDEHNLLNELSEGNVSLITEDADNVSLFLDGYDEIAETEVRDWLNKAINNIVHRYRNIKIIVASRSNADYEQLLRSEFHIFHIGPLSRKEIEDYLIENGINAECFFGQVNVQRLEDFCANIFYLSEMVCVWCQDGQLPSKSKLMDTIISARISADSDHYKYTSGSIARHIKNERKRFERMALVMQCMHRDYLTTDEITRLTEEKEREILEYHGLWLKNAQDKWQFAHNNFREYFAAVALSRKSLDEIMLFISNGVDKPCIRPTWYNTLSYLVTLYTKDDLIKKIYGIQPDLIVLFEKERFSEEERTEQFIILFEGAKNNNQWISIDYSYSEKLAWFASSANTVRYIADELTKDITIKQKQNLLRCLKYFDSFYDSRDDAVKGIISIVANKENADYLRSDALRVMVQHPNDFLAQSEFIANLLRAEDDESVRNESLRFLEEAGNIEQYFDVVILEMKRCSQRYPELISLLLSLKRITRNITDASSALALLTYYRDTTIPAEGNMEEDVFLHCCDVGVATYSGTSDSILKCLLDITKQGTIYVSRDKYQAIKSYMVKTNTVDTFLNAALEIEPIHVVSQVLYDLMCDEMVTQLLKCRREGKISDEKIGSILNHFPYGDDWQNKVVELFCDVLHTKIVIERPVEYSSKQKQEHQAFINALFDENAFAEIGTRVCDIFGIDTLISKEKRNNIAGDKLNRLYEDKALCDWYYSLAAFVPNSSTLSFGEYETITKNSNEYLMFATERVLRSNRSIIVSEAQRKKIAEIVLDKLSRLEIDKAFVYKGKVISYLPEFPICLSLMKILDIECDRELAIKLLSVPPILFRDESMEKLPACVTKWLDEQTVIDTIIANIHAGGMNRHTSTVYTNFCLEHKIRECKDDIVRYITDKNQSDGYVYVEINYICELFGVGTLLTEILPFCFCENMLDCIVKHIPLGMKSQELDALLWKYYKESGKMKWLGYLINRNDAEALNEYYDLAQKAKKLPDIESQGMISQTTEAILTVSNPECIETLISLIKLTCAPDFVDDEVFGLCASCYTAMGNIAKTNYSLVVDALETDGDKDAYNDKISVLKQIIEAQYVFNMDMPLSFESALLLTGME